MAARCSAGLHRDPHAPKREGGRRERWMRRRRRSRAPGAVQDAAQRIPCLNRDSCWRRDSDGRSARAGAVAVPEHGGDRAWLAVAAMELPSSGPPTAPSPATSASGFTSSSLSFLLRNQADYVGSPLLSVRKLFHQGCIQTFW
uniref:Uncharacterized protein n=1 Tax=Arundo donax TaxID=35708 RepID=A0A0A9DAY2_ARUDO